MIGVPFDNNDLVCLGSISEVIAELVENHDLLLAEIAAQHQTTESLAAWIRALPQRNDEGDPTDGPKVEACEPVQRLRIPAPDPNCVERAALYLGVAELIDPRPVRQLATLDFEWGRHTFPLESGGPVILDPSVPADDIVHAVLSGALAGPAVSGESPVPVASVDPHEPAHRPIAVGERHPERHTSSHPELVPVGIDVTEAIEYTTHLAEAGARATRNGPNRARLARNALHRLMESGTAPSDERTIDAVGWFFAQAESTARMYGTRALAIVQTTAKAISNLIDDILAQQHQRNLSFGFGGSHYEIPSWAETAGKIGLGVGALYFAPQLAALGLTGPMVKLVEEELNAEGLSLGALAKPESSLATALTGAMTNKPATGKTRNGLKPQPCEPRQIGGGFLVRTSDVAPPFGPEDVLLVKSNAKGSLLGFAYDPYWQAMDSQRSGWRDRKTLSPIMEPGMRVELDERCPLWKQGAKYGTIEKVTKDWTVIVKMDDPEIGSLQRFTDHTLLKVLTSEPKAES